MSRWNNSTYTNWFTVEQIAALAGDTVENMHEYIREDRIPYAVFPEGILIWLSGFQECMEDLYNLSGFLENLYARDDEDV